MKKQIDLTDEEKKVILDIAARAGKDRDGDIIEFFVQDDVNDVHVIETPSYIADKPWRNIQKELKKVTEDILNS